MITNNKLFFMLLFASFLIACGHPQYTDIPEENKPSTFDEAIPPLDAIVRSIELGKRVESSNIGWVGAPSDQWRRYGHLQKVATTDQLIALTGHKSPAVRCYAFYALLQRNSNQTFKVLIDHVEDTTHVETQSGCIGMTRSVGGLFIDAVNNSDNLAFTKKERRIIDSLASSRSVEIKDTVTANGQKISKRYRL